MKKIYSNQNNITYLDDRKPFAWVKYIHIKN